jgi:hypothetical protein
MTSSVKKVVFKSSSSALLHRHWSQKVIFGPTSIVYGDVVLGRRYSDIKA